MSSFDEALAHTGPLVAAWDYSNYTREFLALYAVPAHAPPSRLAETEVTSEAREDLIDQLVARRIRIGGAYTTMESFLWVVDEIGASVWVGGKTVATFAAPPANLASVELFVDPDDMGHRGVRFATRDNTHHLVAEEHDTTPALDPAYGADELFSDSMWAMFLGRQLATWALVPFLDHRRNTSSAALELVVARASRALADMLSSRAGAGELQLSMGSVGRSADLAFRLPSDRQTLDLATTFASGGTHVASLKQGTTAQIAAFLRRVSTPSTVLLAMNAAIEARR